VRRSSARVVALMVLAGAVFILASAAPAAAHPLGNFTVNTSSGIEVVPGQIRIRYALDMAEIPTFQEAPLLDPDGDGVVEEVEGSGWAWRTAAGLAGDLLLSIDGRPAPLTTVGATAALRPGQGGLEVLRLTATFTAPAPSRGQVRFRDRTFADRIGWHEVTATGRGGAAVHGATVPGASPSGALRAYPDGLLSSPLDVRSARFRFRPGEQAAPPAATGSGTGRPGVEAGGLAALIDTPQVSVSLVLLALGVAFGVGALHALAPGHGKTITAAYLAAGDGRVRHAVGAALAVSTMHTAAVAAVGVLVLSAERLFPAERVYPWLGLAAGAVAVVLGGTLLMARLGGHGHGHPHRHGPDGPRPLSRRGLVALAISGGILPSPTAVLVLVGAVAVHRVAFGMALVGAFALGLAAALAAVGLLAVRARDALAGRLGGRMAAAVPLVGALAVTVMGLVVAARAAMQL
jgi:nickel/cobalt exporter